MDALNAEGQCPKTLNQSEPAAITGAFFPEFDGMMAFLLR